MAGPLAAIERFFERVFERPPARLFAPKLEPEYLQRELFRALEAERQMHGRRTYVPTVYRIQLNNSDVATLSAQPALAADLAEAVRAYARGRGYVLGGRPVVRFEPSGALDVGEVEVVADANSVPKTERRRPNGGAAHPPPPPSNGSTGGPRIDAGHTATYEAARPNPPRATIAVHVPGRAPWRLAVGSGPLRVGRALDNDLVLPDDRVSRHHGQLSVRFGTLVYVDLGSTNGSFVNGVRVTEIALGPSDVVQLGGSALTIESGH
jgi:FHA domain-containing protein